MANGNQNQPGKDESKDEGQQQASAQQQTDAQASQTSAPASKKKAERGEEKPAWMVDPDYNGPITVAQAEKRNAHFAALKDKRNK